jgi:peroxiredoxin
MTQPPADILQRIEGLLRAGKQQEARLLLMEYLKSNLSSARAWWLMSQAVTDLNQQMDCLQRVLRLDPGNRSAQEQLDKLKDSGNQSPASPSAIFTAESKPPETKASSDNVPVAPSWASSQTVPRQPAPEQKAAPIHPAPASLENKEPKPVRKPKKKWWILDLLMAAFFICLVSIAGIYLWSQQRTKVAETQATSIQETQDVIQLLTKLPTLTFTPTWTASPTLTDTFTATTTETSTQSPTLEFTATNTPIPPSRIGPVTGLYAPDFNLIDLDTGQNVTLSQFAGQPVLIFFWATWCPYCRGEISSLETIHQAYKDQGLVILAVDGGEATSTVEAFQNSNKLTFRILLDPGKTVALKYKVSAVPKHYFIDSSGKITYIKLGSMEYNQLESRVKAIMP